MNDVSLAPRIDPVATACPQRRFGKHRIPEHFRRETSQAMWCSTTCPGSVRNAAYTPVDPTTRPRNPESVAWSDSVGALLRIGAPTFRLTGSKLASSAGTPCALRHAAVRRPATEDISFGHWAGQLGDGRAITLAELIWLQWRAV
jgi:uncharacterized protein YdiU (UPF0061 family)